MSCNFVLSEFSNFYIDDHPLLPNEIRTFSLSSAKFLRLEIIKFRLEIISSQWFSYTILFIYILIKSFDIFFPKVNNFVLNHLSYVKRCCEIRRKYSFTLSVVPDSLNLMDVHVKARWQSNLLWKGYNVVNLLLSLGLRYV